MISLNYRKIGEANSEYPPLIILHGLFGMLDNWLSLGKRYSEAGFTVYLIDQRNHGKSPHSEDFDYYILAEDLYDFLNQHDINSAIVMGHSMGGKTAMQFAVTYPEKVYKLAVLDIAPKDYPAGHETIFEGIFAVDLEQVSSRQDIQNILKEYIDEKGVWQFLMKNLKRKAQNSGFEWKANFRQLHQNYEDILMNSLSPYDEFGGLSLFVNGGKSDRYISKDDYPLIRKKFPEAEIQVIADAGHWLHAEKPDELFDITIDFFKN